MAMPVRLPAGRLRLATRPSATGSLPMLKTMGMLCVAALAASADDALMSVRDDELNPTQTTSRELAQECGPECLGLGGTYIHAENLTPAVAVDADCDDHGDRHDATVLAHLHVGCVDPQIRPVSFYGAGEEGFHLLVDLLAQP